FPNDDSKDEFWLGDKNLYAITRYNPSSKYAMTVFLLSEQIAKIGN
ncbi:lytic murein transglycosylase, partial [SAR86 cluster bacterium]|nr:lytic murein transglycosylase [SAR86 cluster bacterium]